MTIPRNPTNRVQPLDDLGPTEREVFATLADLASTASNGFHAMIMERIAQVIVRARSSVEAGKLADAVVLVDLAHDLAARLSMRLPPSLLPTVGRA